MLEDVLDGEFLGSRDMVVSMQTDAGPLHVLGSPIRFDGVRGQYTRRRGCTSTPTRCSGRNQVKSIPVGAFE